MPVNFSDIGSYLLDDTQYTATGNETTISADTVSNTWATGGYIDTYYGTVTSTSTTASHNGNSSGQYITVSPNSEYSAFDFEPIRRFLSEECSWTIEDYRVKESKESAKEAARLNEPTDKDALDILDSAD